MCIENIRDRTHRRTGARLPFSTLEAGELEAGYQQHIGGEMVMMFVSRFWRQLIRVKDTHLGDGAYFEGFLWLFLKVIVERDWLGCEDVDECLDKFVLWLTRHINGNGWERFTLNARRKHVSAFAHRQPGPARRTPTLHACLSLPSILGRGFAIMAVSTPPNVHLL